MTRQTAIFHTTRSDAPGWRERVALDDIRPTQMAVGMQVVAKKRRKVERHVDSGRRLRRFLDKRPLPAILGPDEDCYIIDHHHLGLALWQCEVDEVMVRIVGDLSDLPRRAFLRAMSRLGLLHAFDGDGRKVCASLLPKSIAGLQPDPYRDLAWSVREAGGFRKTQVPFSEFAWANYFRTRISPATLRRDFELACDRALCLARSPEARRLPGSLHRA